MRLRATAAREDPKVYRAGATQLIAYREACLVLQGKSLVVMVRGFAVRAGAMGHLAEVLQCGGFVHDARDAPGP